MEHLVAASKWRIILAYVTAILLYASGPFAADFCVYDLVIQKQDDYRALSDEEKEEFKESQPEGTWLKYFPKSIRAGMIIPCLLLLMFILGGFLTCGTLMDPLY